MAQWEEIESESRKPLGNGVLHPDECVAISIQGARWYVRPLYPPEGIRFTPLLDGGDVSFDVNLGDSNAELQAFAEDIATGLPERLDGTTLLLGGGDSGGYLSLVCMYIIALLDQQYTLTNAQKTELLSFRGNTAPRWLEQGIRHAQSQQPEPPEADDGEET
jgi:hypothetical protein